MANPTTYFGWVMPNSADLVTDLPADFAVFGQGVDTSMQYLLGGTTGQVLSKTSNTNMAFTWINNDQGDITGVTAGTGITVTSPTGPVPTVAIDTAVTVDKTTAQTLTNKTLTSPALTTPTISTATTNGDLLYGTGSGALARLGIGTTGQVLNVSGGIPAWATPSAGSMTLLSTTTLSGASTTISSISGSYKNLYIEVSGFYPDAANSIRLRINGLTTGVYRDSTKAAQGSALATTTTGTFCVDVDSVSGTENFGYIYINNYASTTNWKILDIYSLAKNNNGATYVTFYPNYLYVRETNAVSSITLFPVSGNWSAGTVRVYGVN